MSTYLPRYEGTRWHIVFGCDAGVERFALIELQRIVQDYFPYVARVVAAQTYTWDAQHHHLLIGTRDNNRFIRELIERGALPPTSHDESYSLACVESPWNAPNKVIAISGHDPRGVLYGVIDFNTRILHTKVRTEDPNGARAAFDKVPTFTLADAPAITHRGIWTWGYVIYDYRRFIDTMARLKMNMLTIWNDCVPLNAREVIDYAHSRGVAVIWGFHWGWGSEFDLADRSAWKKLRDEVHRNYIDNYAPLGVDGIYFQTVTEHSQTHIQGQSVASLACGMVNEIAASLYTENPDLVIQFGLHAQSIVDNFVDLSPLDERIQIVWEDAGVTPWSYCACESCDPESQPAHLASPMAKDFETTLAYAKRLVAFRKPSGFGMVPKGFMCLRWGFEFEHHSEFILGERSAAYRRFRQNDRQIRWDAANAEWLRHFPLAMRFYRDMLATQPTSMTVTGLIEDGTFEESLQLCVAMFGEMLWNPHCSDNELLEASARTLAAVRVMS